MSSIIQVDLYLTEQFFSPLSCDHFYRFVPFLLLTCPRWLIILSFYHFRPSAILLLIGPPFSCRPLFKHHLLPHVNLTASLPGYYLELKDRFLSGQI